MKRKKNTKNSKRSQKNSQLPKFVCTAKINIVCVFVVCMCVCITTLSLPSNSLQVKFPQKRRKLRYHISFLFAFVCVCVEYVTWMLFDGTISKLSVTVSHFLVFLSRSFSFHSHQRRRFTRISLARSLSLSFISHSVLPFWREFCIY